MEDHELLLRVFRAGFRGLYDPTLLVMAPVRADRLDRAYHRRWHRGHGHFFAVLRDIDIEASARRLLDVPLHLYRAAVTDALGWTLASMRGNCEEALAREMRLQFFAGFARERIRHYLTGPRRKAEVSVPSPALSREPEPEP